MSVFKRRLPSLSPGARSPSRAGGLSAAADTQSERQAAVDALVQLTAAAMTSDSSRHFGVTARWARFRRADNTEKQHILNKTGAEQNRHNVSSSSPSVTDREANESVGSPR